MNSLSTPVNVGAFVKNGSLRFNQTNSNLKINGFCFDIKWIVQDDVSGEVNQTKSWEFLRKMNVNISLRIGSGVGTQISLISNVPLYDLLMYSDYVAGVSMRSTSFTVGELARISGYVDLGFIGMGSRDALDVSVSLTEAWNANTALNFAVNAIYKKSCKTLCYTYSECKPTGADSPYTNVIGLYYCGDDIENNETAVCRDDEGTKSVNIEDAIAYSNSVGNFEFFTRFGCIYEDTFGISQDVSFRVPPVANSQASILVKRIEFMPELLKANTDDSKAELASLLEKVKVKDENKYKYLVEIAEGA